jgi:hypothetical protein
MISKAQKMLLHIYADAAGLSDPTYRDHLRHAAGVSSSADRTLSQQGFEAAMAALETVLFMRVHAGEVANPLGRSRYITSESYWRGKLPRVGYINTRQAYRIQELWQRLQEYLPPEHRNLVYLGGIIRKATGKVDPGYTCLSSGEADHLIDALKDRLAHAIRSGVGEREQSQPEPEFPPPLSSGVSEREQSQPQEEEVPF